MTEKELQKDLSIVCKTLMLKQPFYGLLLLNLQKIFTTKVKTAGVGLQGINYKLLINPDFWQSLSTDHRCGLLQHELMHIAFFHCTDMFKHQTDKEISNIAQDIEINQKIDNELLPPDGCTLEKFEKYGLYAEEGSNTYYNKLMNAKKNAPPPPPAPSNCSSNEKCDDGDEETQGSGSGEDGDNDNQDDGQNDGSGCTDLMQAIEDAIQNGKSQTNMGNDYDITLPEHEWDEVEGASETAKKLIERQILTVLDEVAEQTIKARGTVPGHIAEKLAALKKITPPKFNWKAFMRRFIGNSTKYNIKKTKRKQSKRFELDFGMKVESFSHVLLAIDSSASVSTKEVKEFMNEIYHMNKTGHDFSLVFADTSMGKVIKYKRNMEFDIEGRGGTDFNEVVDYFNASKSKYSTLIYLTDGEAPAPEAKIKNVLWVLSEQSSWTDHLPGKTIQLN